MNKLTKLNFCKLDVDDGVIKEMYKLTIGAFLKFPVGRQIDIEEFQTQETQKETYVIAIKSNSLIMNQNDAKEASTLIRTYILVTNDLYNTMNSTMIENRLALELKRNLESYVNVKTTQTRGDENE